MTLESHMITKICVKILIFQNQGKEGREGREGEANKTRKGSERKQETEGIKCSKCLEGVFIIVCVWVCVFFFIHNI